MEGKANDRKEGRQATIWMTFQLTIQMQFWTTEWTGNSFPLGEGCLHVAITYDSQPET